jgi:hypothetical protein
VKSAKAGKADNSDKIVDRAPAPNCRRLGARHHAFPSSTLALDDGPVRVGDAALTPGRRLRLMTP